MDPATPPNIPEDPRTLHHGGSGSSGYSSGPGGSTVLPSAPAGDSVSILTTSPANDTDSIQTGHPVTDGDSIQTANAAYDTDSNQTTHLAYETDSNRTLNPAFDTDCALHPAFTLERMGGEGPSTSFPPNPSMDPPPYSPPDPKTAYLVYPTPLPHNPNQPVITCQPGANPSAFYQTPFPSPSTYPSYTIYMNGALPGEEQPSLPKDYLTESVLVTVFCCWMSGLIAVMYSHETRAALARGDVREAEKTSQKARTLVLFSLIFGIIVIVGWVVYVLVALLA
ncbi:proline-rich transmembrane protein 1 [Triplophysa rosa]|uniref:proline-rich transmembrane protein 1 n=1 Tax=Triplophysa rosa TaxID=992332 RepID=UPI0025462099|nr:proline-rich transmembrane protein 1 [Triplophysa rosa]